MSSPSLRHEAISTHQGETRLKALSAITDALARLRYGAVQVVVHDGKVVQLEVTERQRFT